jgi:hypothetical protein
MLSRLSSAGHMQKGEPDEAKLETEGASSCLHPLAAKVVLGQGVDSTRSVTGTSAPSLCLGLATTGS